MEISKIKYSKLSLCDNQSRVFEIDNKYYRGIAKGNRQLVELLNSSLIKELTERKYIPKYDLIENHPLKEFEIVLEMETANYVTYPHQWSFDMLKDACILYLEIYEIALKHGYTIKDGHPYNIVFFDSKPMFVDLGSFIPSNDINLNEFVKTMLYPLLIWSHGFNKVAHTLLRDDKSVATFSDIRSTYIGLLLLQKSRKKRFLDILKYYKLKNVINSKRNITEKLSLVKNITQPKYKTRWDKYHDDYISNSHKPTTRFIKLIELINSYNDIKSVFDIACNKGYLSILIENNCPQINKIVASDYDENALNDLYLSAKTNKIKKITPSIDDIIRPTNNYQEKEIAERFKSDCVIVLALTHHLILTQNYNLDVIIETFARYTNKYLFIEFMPMGLWGGGDNPAPLTPDYYNENWFVQGLEKKFKIHEKMTLEKNRTLFVCSKNNENKL